MRAKDLVGRRGEELAARYLRAAGYQLVERNWRCRAGELDIVARDGGVLVFCEVKTRTSAAFGRPVEAVDRAKARRLRRLAAAWLAAHRRPYTDVRFDVVSVYWPPGAPVAVEHLRGVL